MKKTIKILLIVAMVTMTLFLQGCWLLFDFICPALGDDAAHCVQWMAVKDENPDGCDNVPQKEQFKDSGSNPPKDKCYLMIAENTGDTSACDKIQGGMFSYTKEECYMGAAVKHGDGDLCEGSPQEMQCRNQVGAKTGNCGTGYDYDETAKACVKSEDGAGSCPKDEIYQKCTGSHTIEICNMGKLSTESCPNGCFEAACRDKPGETDIPEEKEDKTEETGDEEADKDADKEKDEEEEDDEEKPECKTDKDCGKDEECAGGICVPVFAECEKDPDCDALETCQDGECVLTYECEDDLDCDEESKCEKGKCVKGPECREGDKMCMSPMMHVACIEGKLLKKDCEFGCKDDGCMTKEEKDKEDEKEKEESSCKEGYAKCLSDVSVEYCEDGEKTEGYCEFGCEKGKCKPEKEKCPWWNPFCEDNEDAASDAKEFGELMSGPYMDALDKEIELEKDPAKLAGLQKYKEFLEGAGDKMEQVQTTLDDLQKIKRIFLDSYDPSMDIENMKVDKILRKSLTDKIGDSLDTLKFWKGPKTEAMVEEETALDQLKVYQAMLERQGEIDFLKQSRKDRLVGTIVDSAKEKMTEELKERATDLAEGVAGTAFMTVGIVGKAIDTVQDEAQQMMFTGLIKAYNRRRAALEEDMPDASPEDIHRMAVEQVQDNPYLDSKSYIVVAQHGNLLANKDCQDSSNPLCIDRRVFWTSMDKSYAHLNRDKLFKREMDQLDRRFEKSKNS